MNEIEQAAHNVWRRWNEEIGAPGELQTFTTHQVAAVCGVCVRTVCHWCDRALLYCYRLPPTGTQAGRRRIPRADLVAFMRANRMPSRRPELLSLINEPESQIRAD